ncbi:MAG: carnitine dehydratase [Gammaproteobacteria bacterium]|nr:carnitine dehydratase [Gammaproteobacteria bacterium]
MSGPLSGIRIVEVGTMIAVPAATYQLATQGAEVIKVEDVTQGDELRYYGSHKGGMSAWFINANGGKRSIAVNLRAEQGKEILWRLLADADVMIQGFRPGALERLGFGSDAVRARHPNLVYCSSSGFGPEGPYADLPVYDPVIQALSGWAGAQTTDDGPSLIHAMVADKIAALTTAQALCAALVQRAATGTGLHVEMSMLEANIGFVWSDTMMHASLLDDDATHRPNLAQTYRLLRCRDGSIAVTAGTDTQWAAFGNALDRPDLVADANLATAAGRASNVEAWYEAMDSAVAPFSMDEVVRRLRGADVAVAPVLDPAQVADDPQVASQNLLREIDHPVAGRVRQPRPTAAWFGGDVSPGPAPLHGEHTDELLTQLGYDDAAVSELRKAGTVGRKS